MEYVKNKDAVKHANSPNCTAYEYPMKNSEINIGVVEIKHRYPDEGYAMNHKCTEMGYVLKGSGRLVTETHEVMLSSGDVILIPHGEKYYWEGDLTIVVSATPAWYPAQHAVIPLQSLTV
jgi:mannose-6-phosphate isomerase-like protein (cupin superfamily)